MEADVNCTPQVVIPSHYGAPAILSAITSVISLFSFAGLVLGRLAHGGTESGLLDAPWYIAVIGISSAYGITMTSARYIAMRPRLELTGDGIAALRTVGRRRFWRWDQLGRFYHSSPPSRVEAQPIDTKSEILALNAKQYRTAEPLAHMLNRYRDSVVTSEAVNE